MRIMSRLLMVLIIAALAFIYTEARGLRSVPDIRLWDPNRRSDDQVNEAELSNLEKSVEVDESESKSMWQRMMGGLRSVTSISTWLWPKAKENNDEDNNEEEDKRAKEKKGSGPFAVLDRMRADLLSFLPFSGSKSGLKRKNDPMLHPEMYRTHFGQTQQLIAAESVGIPYETVVIADNVDALGQIQPYTFVRPRHRHLEQGAQPRPANPRESEDLFQTIPALESKKDELENEIGVEQSLEETEEEPKRRKKMGLLDTLTERLVSAKDWLMRKTGMARTLGNEVRSRRARVDDRSEEDSRFHSKPYQTDFEPAFFSF